MRKLWMALGLAALLGGGSASAQVETDLTNGDRVVSAITMGEGDHVVIALHGSDNDRNFFFLGKGGQLGRKLANAGFRVIAVTWSGRSGGFSEVDAAVAQARATGALKVSLMGHSRGGQLAANYALQQADGTIDTVIQLSSSDDQGLPMTRTKKLFVFSKYDRVANWQPAAFAKSAQPKQLIEVGGGGHGVGALISEKPDLVRDVVRLLRQ